MPTPNPWHYPTLRGLKELFRQRGYTPRPTTSLPTGCHQNSRYYIPDAIVEKNGIMWILEVDCHYKIKYVMGGIYLGNLCMSKDNRKSNFIYVLREIKDDDLCKIRQAVEDSRNSGILNYIETVKILKLEEARQFIGTL